MTSLRTINTSCILPEWRPPFENPFFFSLKKCILVGNICSDLLGRIKKYPQMSDRINHFQIPSWEKKGKNNEERKAEIEILAKIIGKKSFFFISSYPGFFVTIINTLSKTKDFMTILVFIELTKCSKLHI